MKKISKLIFKVFPDYQFPKIKEIREQLTKRENCSCGFKKLNELPIRGYTPHKGGYEIDGKLWWLYIHCPRCGYEWSIHKLGAKRENI